MKIWYVLYALFIVLVSTLYNWSAMTSSGGRSASGSGWSSTHAGGTWGGGGGHK